MPGGQGLTGEDSRCSAYTLEVVIAVGEKFDPGAGDEIDDGSRDEHLVGGGERGNACRDVNSDPADIVAAQFDLGGVDAATELQAGGAGGL